MFINFPEVHLPVEGLDLVTLPKMVTVRQTFDAAYIADIKGHIEAEMAKLKNPDRFQGKRLCLTVGSRGIPHLEVIVKTLCDGLKAFGALPFIVPAMASHGGATAEGQKELIAGYGITEEAMGVPILSSMEVVEYGKLACGMPLYCDKFAFESDGIIVFNKVKPHTDFRGPHESGMAKMIAIGLAKYKGASLFHMKGFGQFSTLIPEACEVFLEKAPVAFGIGLIQNAYDDISEIEFCEKDELMRKDAELQVIAKRKLPMFSFSSCDVLVVDEIGKNISGGGHDPNITGKTTEEGFTLDFKAQIMFVRGLSKETHHNACGLHVAEITTRRCLNDVDWTISWINSISANRLNGCRIPMYVNNDKEALLLAVRTCDDIDYRAPRIARIKNTLCLDTIQVSEALYKEIQHKENIQLISDPHEMTFDEEGFLTEMSV